MERHDYGEALPGYDRSWNSGKLPLAGPISFEETKAQPVVVLPGTFRYAYLL